MRRPLERDDRTTIPPVRIVHIGLGAFHRAHQAWYTAHAADAAEWGIAAFTGRSAAAARALEPQQGLYTLIVRGPNGDARSIIRSIVEVRPGSDVARLRELVARPEVALITTTVTERGYRLAWDGQLDRHDEELAADLDDLQRDLATAEPTTALGRLVAGLGARHRAQAGPIAVVPCDNVPDNGAFLRRGVIEAAREVSLELALWIEREVSFVSTSVDRITPRLDALEAERALAEAPYLDRAPVITEPHTDWVLSGDFPAGRPRWETAGARFVDDIEPWERRKLWMLNGAHTLLAVGGPARGHRTVADAIADPTLSDRVEALWREAAAHLPPEVDASGYGSRLRSRFENPRIAHELAQIATDSLEKLRLRIVPVAAAERRAGRVPAGCAFAIGEWLAAEPGIRSGDRDRAAAGAVHRLDPALATDAVFMEAVRTALDAAPTAAAADLR